MALSETVLAADIAAELNSVFPVGSRDIEPDVRDKAARAIAAAIIDHLTSAGVVTGGCPAGGGPLVNGRIT